MDVLIIGDGLLGSELKRQNPDWEQISRKQGTFNMYDDSWKHKLINFDCVINCIAHTDTYDPDPTKHMEVNVMWVTKFADICNEMGIKGIHISTDYLYANSITNASETDIPLHHNSWYGYSKLVGDVTMQQKSARSLVIRCGHKPKPFPYDKATTAIKGNFDYVDVIAEKISQLILIDVYGLFNVGTELKTMYDLAVRTKPDVEKTDELPIETMPTDVSMDLSKLKASIAQR